LTLRYIAGTTLHLTPILPAFFPFSSFFASCARALCAAGYLFCGLLCLDRFTTRAFLATKDPRITTAIGNPGAGFGSNPPGTGLTGMNP
jgi:hypothetical protein